MPDFGELGGTGLRSSFGFVEHEFLRDLQGDKGARTYREMSDNDAVVGALILAFKLVLRRVKWTVRPAEESEAGQEAADFMETVLYQDMSHTWADFISEVMSMLVYGWSYFEIVYKRRLGPTQTDASKRSRFEDGMIGVRKLAPRSQHTLVRWVFDDDGGISGMVQAVDGVTGEIFLPIQKCLHFRTESAGNNPEGRALDPETLIPTPDGWRRLDDLVPGSKVFDEAGRIRYVTARADWFDRPCHKLSFSDGTEIIADDAHQWLTCTLRERTVLRVKGSLRTTAEVAATLKASTRTSNHSIEWASALDYPSQSFPIDPYVLGVWLGDGYSGSGRIACHADDADETAALIAEAGYVTSVVQNGREGCLGRTIKVQGAQPWASDDLATKLRVCGFKQNKHVPEAYLRGSIEQRRALLAGLMDTDGTVDQWGRCEFCNTNYGLASSVAELVRSLGCGHVTVCCKRRQGFAPAWLVKFTPPWSPFRLKRKAAKTINTRKRDKHYIVSAEPVERRRTVCIEVDSPSHLFLVGENMVPTHNSILRNAYRSWRYKSLIEDKEVIGIERELVGLPVISIPGQLLADTSPEAQAKVASYVDIAKNLRMNEQSGVVIPSDPYVDDEGGLSSIRKVEIKLLSTAGSRTIDTGGAIKRYEAAIARSVLADFLTLGTTVGSWALSKSKTDLYLAACEAVMEQVKAPVNAFLIPRVWALNGLPYELMPEADHDAVAPADLAELGSFLERMARAGMSLFPDAAVENVLRILAGLPERDVDAELPEVPAVNQEQEADQGERGVAGEQTGEEG